MRKMILLIGIILIAIVIIPTINNTNENLKEYLDDYFETTDDILRIDYSDNGAYVFKNTSKDVNRCFFFRKSFFGWQYDYDVYASVKVLSKQSGFSLTKLNNENHVDRPVYFGKILDEEIDTIVFKNINNDEVNNATITSKDNIQLWTMYLDDIENEEYIISSFSKNNKLISKVEMTNREIKYLYYKNIEDGIQLKTIKH